MSEWLAPGSITAQWDLGDECHGSGRGFLFCRGAIELPLCPRGILAKRPAHPWRASRKRSTIVEGSDRDLVVAGATVGGILVFAASS